MTTSMHKNIPDTAISYVLTGLSILEEMGVGKDQVLEGTDITDDELKSMDGLTPAYKINRLVNNVERITGLQGTGLYFGCRCSITSHGMLGIATISQSSWREAAKVLAAYCKSRYHALHIEPYEEGNLVGLRYRIDIEDKNYAAYVAEMFSATLFRNLGYFIDADPFDVDLIIRYQHKEPEYAKLYDNLFGSTPTFNNKYNIVLIDKMHLKQELENKNIETSLAAEKSCRNDLPIHNYNSLKEKILHIIDHGNITVNSAALSKQLCMSERTLRRKLALEGTSLRAILDGRKSDEAIAYLKQSHLNISEIAAKLGFYDTASFCKAFKKWKGVSPNTYRKTRLNSEMAELEVHT